jgi:hypothetical protein
MCLKAFEVWITYINLSTLLKIPCMLIYTGVLYSGCWKLTIYFKLFLPIAQKQHVIKNHEIDGNGLWHYWEVEKYIQVPSRKPWLGEVCCDNRAWVIAHYWYDFNVTFVCVDPEDENKLLWNICKHSLVDTSSYMRILYQHLWDYIH